jgi:hypothetical protein
MSRNKKNITESSADGHDPNQGLKGDPDQRQTNLTSQMVEFLHY